MPKSYPGGPGRVNIHHPPSTTGINKSTFVDSPTSISPTFIAVGEIYAADLHNGTIAVAL